MQSKHTFGLIVKDKEGRATQTKFFNIDTVADDATAKNIFVPPTVNISERSVTKGQNVIITGYASPDSDVQIEIDRIIKKEVKVGKDGVYKIAVDTGTLEFSPHQVRAKQTDTILKRESDFSPTQTFVVSQLTAPRADLSGDGRVDIRDWSVFLSRWGSKDESQKKKVDLNGDGKVNILDFSIFIRTLRKK